jgi:hypothetical protein
MRASKLPRPTQRPTLAYFLLLLSAWLLVCGMCVVDIDVAVLGRGGVRGGAAVSTVADAAGAWLELQVWLVFDVAAFAFSLEMCCDCQ